jgi:hypothetical protein
MKPINKVKTVEEARQMAIKWQHTFQNRKRDLSYLYFAKYQEFFTKLGEKFNLTEEFKENCII